MVAAFGHHIAQRHPDLLLIQGDTTTAMAAALAGSCTQRNTEKGRLAIYTTWGVISCADPVKGIDRSLRQL
jgi:hypothetical protein